MARSTSSATDAELVRRSSTGDRSATEALLHRHYSLVRAVCHRIVTNQADAEDATQNAMISIGRALPTFDGRSQVTTWMYRIATNAALDEIRRTNRRPLPADPHLSSVLDSPTATDASASFDDQDAVRGALAQLLPEYRAALVLRHVADMEYEEIAIALDVPIGTVRSRLARGRSALKEILGNSLVDEGRQMKTEEGHP